MYIVQEPFHADYHITQLFGNVVRRAGIASFVETGSFHGITTEWVARKHPNMKVFSCEIDPEYYAPARQRLEGISNVILRNEDSADLLNHLVDSGVNMESTVFWIDAHAFSYRWPLLDEVSIISRYWETAYVIIDDFQVPGREDFGYNAYGEGSCSYDYIQSSIGSRSHSLWYPTYSRPDDILDFCFRGWGLITFGVSDFTPEAWMQQAV